MEHIKESMFLTYDTILNSNKLASWMTRLLSYYLNPVKGYWKCDKITCSLFSRAKIANMLRFKRLLPYILHIIKQRISTVNSSFSMCNKIDETHDTKHNSLI